MKNNDQIEDANYTVEESTNGITQALVEVDVETSISLKTAFMPLFNEADDAVRKAKEITVTDAGQIERIQLARSMRLHLKNIRIEVESQRISLKQESLKKGKAIDGMANIIKYLIFPAEEHLKKQEEFVKRQEGQRKAELAEKRELELQEIGVDTEYYNLAEMNNFAFASLLETMKFQYERKQADQKKEDEERIAKAAAEVKRQKEMEAENKRLKVEAEKSERKAEKEHQELKAILAKERLARSAIEAKRQAEDAKKLQIFDDKMAKEQQESKAKLEKEILAKQAAEDKLAREREERQAAEQVIRDQARLKVERIREARLAPDKKKLEVLAGFIASIEMPDLTSREAQRIALEGGILLNKAVSFIKSESGKL